jgi:hypothetical protein
MPQYKSRRANAVACLLQSEAGTWPGNAAGRAMCLQYVPSNSHYILFVIAGATSQVNIFPD